MKLNWKKLLIFLAIPLATGGFAALLSGGMADYRMLNQPPLSPPGWAFPVVWTILYLAMGYASYRIAQTNASKQARQKALLVYGIQLFLNFLWPIVFFGMHRYLAAFFLLIALWLMIFLTIHLFSKPDSTAADLLIPYLLWVTFALYLNLGVYLLN